MDSTESGRWAFRLYLLFVASWFLHLPGRAEVLGVLRFDLLLLCLITGALIMSESDEHGSLQPISDSRTRRLIALLLGYAIITIPLVQWPGSVLHTGLPNFVKAVVFYYFTARLVTTPARLRRFLLVFVSVQSFRVIEPLYLHTTQGYWGSGAMMSDWEMMNRLAGAPHDVVNPNGLAFIILTLLPFVHYLGPLTRLGTVAYLALLPLFLYALLLTGSRSGMLGFAIIVLAMWLKSRRKLLFAAAIALSLLAVIPTLSDDLSDRYRSIFDSNTKNATTAKGRWEGTRADFVVALRRPFFGHGLGTSLEANANFGEGDQISHNLYAEAAQELGFVGLTILIAMIASIGFSLRSSMAALKLSEGASPLLLRLTDALQVFLAMNVLFSLASYGLSSYEWYFAAGMSDVLRRASARLATARQMTEPASRAPHAAPARTGSAWTPIPSDWPYAH